VHVSDPNDNSIPILHEILVPGRATATQPAPEGQTAAAADALREPGFKTEPVFSPQPSHADEPGLRAELEPVLAPQPVLAPEETRSPEPVLSPKPADDGVRANAAAAAPARAVAPQPPAAPQAAPAVTDVFDRSEPAPPLEAGETVPPDIARDTQSPASLQPDLDADVIAKRLRDRFAGFLTGEGRSVIEARCRDALQEHSTVLVSQITREVALTLESEMTGWVHEAVAEEIARRHSGRG
jgi:hypothetical protein